MPILKEIKAVDCILFAKLSDGTIRQVPLKKEARLALLELARECQQEEVLKVTEDLAPFEVGNV